MISISFENYDTMVSIRAELEKNGIETRPMFTPMHMLPMFVSNFQFPCAEKISKTGINLPSFPDLKESRLNWLQI